jgi:hypothetical protein
MSSEPLYMNPQVLNHYLQGLILNVRHQITVNFVRDSELEQPRKRRISDYSNLQSWLTKETFLVESRDKRDCA